MPKANKTYIVSVPYPEANGTIEKVRITCGSIEIFVATQRERGYAANPDRYRISSAGGYQAPQFKDRTYEYQEAVDKATEYLIKEEHSKLLHEELRRLYDDHPVGD
jgi:hypothetical protein